MNPNTTSPGSSFTTATTIGTGTGATLGYMPMTSVVTIKKVSNGYILEANQRTSVASSLDAAIEILRVAFNENPQTNNSY